MPPSLSPQLLKRRQDMDSPRSCRPWNSGSTPGTGAACLGSDCVTRGEVEAWYSAGVRQSRPTGQGKAFLLKTLRSEDQSWSALCVVAADLLDSRGRV